MPISELQFDTWSHQGSITQSSITYNAIKKVLEAEGTAYRTKNFRVFLQGSYGNDTNIHSESDVDIIICLDDCWSRDLDLLAPEDTATYHRSYVKAGYLHSDFKRDVLSTLVQVYGKDANAGDKAIAIAAGGGRRKADVIASIEYRRYYKFKSLADQSYEPGICFYNRTGTQIANYPKQHSENCTKKHQATGQWFKPMVRIFKNMRGKLVDEGLLDKGIAPSYYLEGLLYNVPNDRFTSTYQSTFYNILIWLQKADKSKFVFANEQYYLVRDNSQVSWATANCETFVAAAIKLWNDS